MYFGVLPENMTFVRPSVFSGFSTGAETPVFRAQKLPIIVTKLTMVTVLNGMMMAAKRGDIVPLKAKYNPTTL